MSEGPRRTVHCADALVWLDGLGGPFVGASFITSLPDVSELSPLTLPAWREWFVDAARRVLRATPQDGVAIFYQTDIKKEGAWVDKGYLCSRAAELEGAHAHWHKVVCRQPPGTTTFGRPAYSHMLCFSRGLRLDVALSTSDVLPSQGESLWTRGMGVLACEAACRYILRATQTKIVVDPFCGRGTALAVANRLGLEAVGVEKSAKRARQAQNLVLPAMPPSPPQRR